MKRLMSVCIALLLISSASGAEWHRPEWTCRQKISVREAFFVATTDLKGFPLLLTIADPQSRIFEKARPDGSDIVFTAADGVTRVPHEIELYRNADKKELVCWVYMPYLFAEENTALYIYYGNPDPPPARKAAKVWQNHYSGVWHLNARKLSGAQGEVRDSTSNRHHGMAEKGSVPSADGMIGRAMKGRIFVKHAKGISYSRDDSFTVEAWVRLNQLPPRGVSLATKTWALGWMLQYHESGRWQFQMSDDARGRGHIVFCYLPDKEPHGKWVYLAAVYDAQSEKVILYINGVRRAETKAAGLNDFSTKRPLVIGSPFEREGLQVSFDEVRLSSTVRSPDWISACYKNQAFPSKRINLGKEEIQN